MLTLRDLTDEQAKAFKNAILKGYMDRRKVWRNKTPEQEEIYRTAFQDGIRASLEILPVKN